MLALFTYKALCECVKIQSYAFELSQGEKRCRNNDYMIIEKVFIQSNQQSFKLYLGKSDQAITIDSMTGYQGIIEQESFSVECISNKCEFIIVPTSNNVVITQKANTLVLGKSSNQHQIALQILKKVDSVKVRSSADLNLNGVTFDPFSKSEPTIIDLKLKANEQKTITANGGFVILGAYPEHDVDLYVDIGKIKDPNSQDFGPKIVPDEKIDGFMPISKLKSFGTKDEPTDESSDTELDNEDFGTVSQEEKFIFEQNFGTCKIMIPGPFDDMKYHRIKVKQGEKFCGVHGLIIGSKQKYTVKVTDADYSKREKGPNGMPKPITSMKDATFEKKQYVYKNPNVIQRMNWNIYSIECDSSNDKYCTFDIIGFKAYGEGNIFMINKNEESFTWNVEKDLFGDSNYLSLWHLPSRVIKFPAEPNYHLYRKEGAFTNHLTKERLFEYQAYGGDTFMIGEDGDFPTKLEIKIGNSRLSVADDTDDFAIPPMLGRLPDADKRYALSANEVNKEYQSPGSYNPKNSEVMVKDGLSGGAIAAIVIVVILVVVIVVAVCVWFFVFRKKGEQKSSSSDNKDEENNAQ